MEEISETISIINEMGNYYYWVRVVKENKNITSRFYKNREECIADAKILHTEKNKGFIPPNTI